MRPTFLLICSAALIIFTASSALADRNVTRVRQVRRNWSHSPHWNGSRNWVRGNNWQSNWRWHHRNRIVFAGSFGYPFLGYPYYFGSPYYYGYYPPVYGYGGGGYGYRYRYNSNTKPAYENRGDRNTSNRTGGTSTVAQVQRQLTREGYYKGDIDGAMGSRTHYAIRAYKRAHGLSVDGEIDSDLLGALNVR